MRLYIMQILFEKKTLNNIKFELLNKINIRLKVCYNNVDKTH